MTDPLTHVPLDAHAYVHEGTGYAPATLARYVASTGARLLPFTSHVLDLERLVAAIASSASTFAASDVLFAMRVAQRDAPARTLAAEALQPASFFDDQVRTQLEVTLAMCELDAVTDPTATVRAFAEGPWALLRVAFAGYLTTDPLRAVEAARQVQERLDACLDAASTLFSEDIHSGVGGGEVVLFHLGVLGNVGAALDRLCDAVRAVVGQPATLSAADTIDTLFASVLMPLATPASADDEAGTGGGPVWDVSDGEDGDDGSDGSDGSENEGQFTPPSQYAGEQGEEVAPWAPHAGSSPPHWQDIPEGTWTFEAGAYVPQFQPEPLLLETAHHPFPPLPRVPYSLPPLDPRARESEGTPPPTSLLPRDLLSPSP